MRRVRQASKNAQATASAATGVLPTRTIRVPTTEPEVRSTNRAPISVLEGEEGSVDASDDVTAASTTVSAAPAASAEAVPMSPIDINVVSALSVPLQKRSTSQPMTMEAPVPEWPSSVATVVALEPVSLSPDSEDSSAAASVPPAARTRHEDEEDG